MFTGFHVENLHNLICTTCHIIELGWWRLSDLNPCTVELTFRGYNPVIKQTFYQKSLSNLNGPAKIKYEMYIFHQFFKTRETPITPIYVASFALCILKQGSTNQPRLAVLQVLCFSHLSTGNLTGNQLMIPWLIALEYWRSSFWQRCAVS